MWVCEPDLTKRGILKLSHGLHGLRGLSLVNPCNPRNPRLKLFLDSC
jgi:hypothetical protein